jgi:hypothetical protein
MLKLTWGIRGLESPGEGSPLFGRPSRGFLGPDFPASGRDFQKLAHGVCATHRLEIAGHSEAMYASRTSVTGDRQKGFEDIFLA